MGYWHLIKKDKNQSVQKAEEAFINPFIGFKVSRKEYPVTYTLDQARDNLLVINKKHALPSDYVPELITWNGVTLKTDTLEAYKKLISSAKSSGVNITAISSFRSYSDQAELFNEYVKKDGQEKAETYSARPGHSEHQSGLAVDIGLPSGNCNLMVCMANTKEGKWLAENAHEYGFIVRYPEEKVEQTGYQFEPWHIRFVGTEIAKSIFESSYTLDEYFGITAGPYAPQATTN